MCYGTLMDKPTDEQIQFVWERCGFKETRKVLYCNKDKTAYRAWLDPDGNKDHWTYSTPPIDLNNLFKYAVPKLEPPDFSFYQTNDGEWIVSLYHEVITIKDKDPALALFWAIYKAFGGKCKS